MSSSDESDDEYDDAKPSSSSSGRALVDDSDDNDDFDEPKAKKRKLKDKTKKDKPTKKKDKPPKPAGKSAGKTAAAKHEASGGCTLQQLDTNAGAKPAAAKGAAKGAMASVAAAAGGAAAPSGPSAPARSAQRREPRDAGEAVQMILEETQRPHSVADLMPLLMQRYKMSLKKQAMEMTLGTLGDAFRRKEVQTKQYLYWADQGSLKAPSRQEVAELSREIKELETEFTTLKAAADRAEREAAALRSQPTNAELDDAVFHAEVALGEAEKRNTEASAPGATISKAEATKTKRKFNHARDIWAKRRRQCKHVVEAIAEGFEKKPDDLIKTIELETDEAAGVELPDPVACD